MVQHTPHPLTWMSVLHLSLFQWAERFAAAAFARTIARTASTVMLPALRATAATIFSAVHAAIFSAVHVAIFCAIVAADAAGLSTMTTADASVLSAVATADFAILSAHPTVAAGRSCRSLHTPPAPQDPPWRPLHFLLAIVFPVARPRPGYLEWRRIIDHCGAHLFNPIACEIR